MILQKETFNEITEKFCKEIADLNVDYLVLPEARGFLFGSAVADRLNVGIIPLRKNGKLPPDYVEAIYNSSAKLNVSSGKNNYVLEINRGDMVDPYPNWCLICNRYRKYYNVNANLDVEFICGFEM